MEEKKQPNCFWLIPVFLLLFILFVALNMPKGCKCVHCTDKSCTLCHCKQGECGDGKCKSNK